MPYTHAGEIGDIWKHLPLCEILSIEKPKRYIETNSAFPSYSLPGKPQLDYGIHHLMKNIQGGPALTQSVYYKILLSFHENPIKFYLGSPGLAMTILKDIAQEYIFCDLEPEPLAEVHSFAKPLGIEDRVKTIHGDSIEFGFRILSELTRDDFVFLDPYRPFDQNQAGVSFFDLFVALVKANCRCALWYGYETLRSKEQIASFARREITVADAQKHRLTGINVFLKTLQTDDILFNPGVPGCGLFIANLSPLSAERVSALSKELITIYREAKYEGFDADLAVDSIEWEMRGGHGS